MPEIDDPSAPIIIIKKKVYHAGHHGGAWKVAYADFVTAMMALFIVLWLLSSSEKVKKAVGSYFQDPTGTGKLAGTTVAGAGENISLVKKEDMADLKDKLELAMKSMPKFEQMKDHVQLVITSEGLRIELLETTKGMFFESGNGRPTATGRELLNLLAEELGKLPNSILIEGHTDAKPYGGNAEYTNWELSTDRANSSRRLMEANGLRPNQVAQVRGFADQRLRTPADPTNAANRRVSLIVQYLQTPEKAAGPSDKGHDAKPEPKPAAETSQKPAPAQVHPPDGHEPAKPAH